MYYLGIQSISFPLQFLRPPLQWLHMLKVLYGVCNCASCYTYIHCVYIVIDSFMMTKLHKDIAMYMMQCVQSEDHTDTTTVKVTDT